MVCLKCWVTRISFAILMWRARQLSMVTTPSEVVFRRVTWYVAFSRFFYSSRVKTFCKSREYFFIWWNSDTAKQTCTFSKMFLSVYKELVSLTCKNWLALISFDSGYLCLLWFLVWALNKRQLLDCLSIQPSSCRICLFVCLFVCFYYFCFIMLFLKTKIIYVRLSVLK